MRKKSRIRGSYLVDFVFAWNFHVSLTETTAVVLVIAYNGGAHVQTSIGCLSANSFGPTKTLAN